MEGIHGAGKGDTYRRVNWDKYSENYDKIFNKKGKKNGTNHRTDDGRTTNRKNRGTRERPSS